MLQRFIKIEPNEKARIFSTNMNEEDFFKKCQEIVNGYIEEVHLYKDYYLFVDEDGKMKSNPEFNFMLYHEINKFQTPIVENAILIKIVNGHIKPIDVDFAKWFVDYFNHNGFISTSVIRDYFEHDVWQKVETDFDYYQERR